MARLPHVRSAALLGVILAGWVFAGMLAAPVYAQQRPPAQATAHALDELANAIAQGKITLTPTPTFSPQPRATPTVAPSETPAPTPTETATPVPVFEAIQAEPVNNAYLRPGPEPWLELALPTGRYLIQTDCSLTPWTEVWYHTSAPNLAGVNDCPLDGWMQFSDTPCAMNDDGVCDLTYDLSYQDYLGSLAPPTAIPAPAAASPPQSPVAPAAPRSVTPAPVRVAQAATPVYIVVTATPDADSTTRVPTPSARPTVTVAPTRTPILSPTTQPTAIPTATATSVPVVAAVESPRLPPLPFDWTGVFIVFGTLIGMGGITALVVHRMRQKHLAQLAKLDGLTQ